MARPGPFAKAVCWVDERRHLWEAARTFAAAGIPVFPCAANGKRPLTVHGFHDATTDLRRIEQWWGQTPSANIGMPTGTASGVVVVDVDVHGPVNGYETFVRARRAGLINGWELLVRSPSGGMHAYYPTNPEVRQRSWQAARAGIDFRGDGGYIIVPPSHRHIDGHRSCYAVEEVNHGTTAFLDSERLRNLLDPRPVTAAGPTGPVAPAPDVERLTAWVSRRPEGERNHGLFWAACKLAEQDVPAADALDVLTRAGGQAGLSEREVTATVRSAYRTVDGVHLASDRRFGPVGGFESPSPRPPGCVPMVLS